jgi:UDP-N-acetylmuramoyl-tripeptide--D-alanyl-D-alanine ligase
MAPIPTLRVPDTLKALQSLAAHWRDRHHLPVMAVVGSVGKTTTKEMAAAVLSTAGPCLKNPGNLNNHIGLPLSVLDMADFHRFAVLELGANQPGEIQMLSRIARPVAAVMTRIGWAHLEGFGSHQNLLDEKGSVLDELPDSGWCALNTDDRYFDELGRRARCRVITYGQEKGDVTADEIRMSGEETSFVIETPMGRERIHLKAFGRHFIENALGVVALAMPLEIPLEQMAVGLDGWKPVSQRGGIFSPSPGVYFIDDTYNANPLSVETALENLAALKPEGMTVAVLGEMKELGDFDAEGHRFVGQRCAQLGIDCLVTVGPRAELTGEGARDAGMDPGRVMVCADSGEAVEAVSALLASGVWVLFKGSRAAGMEQVMEAFVKKEAPAGAGGF